MEAVQVAGRARVPALLGRKSLVVGALTSVGLVVADATRASAAVADPAVDVPRWAPYTQYAGGRQVVSPNNDVVSAKAAHRSSAAYATDTTKWTLSSTYLTPAGADAKINAPHASDNSTYLSVSTDASKAFLSPTRDATGFLSWTTSHVHVARSLGWLIVTDPAYGAVGDGVVNDTAAVQSAIDAAYAGGLGGTVFFPRGTFACTRLTLRSRVILLGASWLSSVLKQRTGTNADFIVLADVNTEQIGLRDLRINGNRAGNSSGNTLTLDNTAGVYTFSDPYHLCQNVFIENSAGDAWRITSGVRESRFLNCHAKLAYAHGFYIAGTDNFFTDCTAATSGQSGWFIADGNNQFISCKSFSNGTRCVNYGLEGEGFYVQNAARNKFIGCEAQDNERNGYVLIGASTKHNNLIGCLADSNCAGQFLTPPQSSTAVGLVLDGCVENVVEGFVAGNQRLTQDVGIQIKNGAARNTVRAIVRAQAAAATSWTASGLSTNDVVVNGNDRSVKYAAVAANYTPDPHEARTHFLTLGASITINDTLTANRYPGARLRFVLTQDATGGRVVTWNAAYLLSAWTPNIAPSKNNAIDFAYDGTNWLCLSANAAA